MSAGLVADLVILGRIVAPFGVKGWVKMLAFGDDPLAWRSMPHCWISPTDTAPDETWSQVGLVGLNAHGTSLVAQFEGVTDRDAAEALCGWYLAAPRDALPAAGKDEYYWGDLVGLAVLTEAGEVLGEVASLLSTGAHDVLCVKDGDTERLIPFVGAHILDVDLAARAIRVDWQKDW